jgi:glutathione S-transferase
MLTLYDAPRCPYCARVRIVVAEKAIEVETIEIDLDDRPAWIYEKNSTGRVPVVEEDGWTLPESAVIMEYLEERYPERPLLPVDLRERAQARLLVNRFDERLGRDYYAFRRGDANELAARLEELEVGQSLYADVAYVPWVIRARDMLGVELPQRIADWLARLEQRPSVAAEVETVGRL